MSNSWDLVVRQRVWMQRCGWALFIAALTAAVASFWAPAMRSAATIFTLLGIQAVSAVGMLQRIADLQAALDMKRHHLDMRTSTLVTQRQRVAAGTSMTLTARDGTRFTITPDISTEFKVEYLG